MTNIGVVYIYLYRFISCPLSRNLVHIYLINKFQGSDFMITLGGLQINTIPIRKDGTPAMNQPSGNGDPPSVCPQRASNFNNFLNNIEVGATSISGIYCSRRQIAK